VMDSTAVKCGNGFSWDLGEVDVEVAAVISATPGIVVGHTLRLLLARCGPQRRRRSHRRGASRGGRSALRMRSVSTGTISDGVL